MTHPNYLDTARDLLPIDKWQKTVDVMAKIFNAPAGFVVQRVEDGYEVVISSNQETNPYPAGAVIDKDVNIFCRKVVKEHAPLYVQDATQDRFWDTNPEVSDDGFKSYCGFPVFWPNGEPFGTICVMDFECTDYRQDYLDLVAEFRDLIEADLEILKQYQVISELAMTDELTGLYNRRGFHIVAQQYIALAKRSNLSLGLFYMDMNNLKRVNDEQGHLAGDNALKTLAQAITSVVREDDIAARLSGDEFVLLAAADSQEKLVHIANRIRKRLQADNLSVSIGSVLLDDSNRDIEHWLACADQRMYMDKRA